MSNLLGLAEDTLLALPGLAPEHAEAIQELKAARGRDKAELQRQKALLDSAAAVLKDAREHARADVANITAWLRHAGLEQEE